MKYKKTGATCSVMAIIAIVMSMNSGLRTNQEGLEIIGNALKLVLMLLGKWFEFDAEKKAKAKEILKEVPNAKDPSSITAMFDAINRL